MKKPTISLFMTGLSRMLMLLVFLVSSNVYAQDNGPTYFQLAYMKVKPGKYSDYLKLETEIWKPIHQERIKQGKATGWYLYQVMYPSGTNAEYDYVIVNSGSDWNSIEHMWDGTMDIAKKVLTKDQLLQIDKTEQTRDLVKSELWSFNDGVFAPGDSASKYQVVNYMKIPEGRWEEYMDMEINLARPVHQEDVNTGGRAGWGIYSMILPYSDNRPYDAAAVDFYYSWDDYGRSNTGELWKKIHPHKSEEYISRQIDNSRSLVKQDILYLIDYVD